APSQLPLPPPGGRRGSTLPLLRVGPCDAHTCIHIVGPPAGLAAASCWGAACARIEDVIDRAFHLAVIDGLGALGGAGEGGKGSAEEPALQQGQLWPGPHHPAQAAPPSASWAVPSRKDREGHGWGPRDTQMVHSNVAEAPTGHPQAQDLHQLSK
uniref:Uncharacterized protein n=1 Tax=Sus scrofa TaxID=9823 RepID=A0A4X1TCA8_PIG